MYLFTIWRQTRPFVRTEERDTRMLFKTYGKAIESAVEQGFIYMNSTGSCTYLHNALTEPDERGIVRLGGDYVALEYIGIEA